jgi:hypothetical protein
MMKLKVAFRNFSKAPKTAIIALYSFNRLFFSYWKHNVFSVRNEPNLFYAIEFHLSL